MPHVRAGKLHAVGLAGGRSTLVPEVAPLSDAGVKDLRLEVWTAVIAPAKLSAEARSRLVKAIPEASPPQRRGPPEAYQPRLAGGRLLT